MTALKEMDGEENVECIWKEMRAALDNAQHLLPLVSNKPEADWVTEEVRQLALKKHGSGGRKK